MLTPEQIRFRRNICINTLRRCDEREESALRWHRQGIHLPADGGCNEYHSHLPKKYLDMHLADIAEEREKYSTLLRELDGDAIQMLLEIAA